MIKMKKIHIVLTALTLMLSLVIVDHSVLAVDTGQTDIRIGFVKDTEVKPDKPNVVPPNGGETPGGTTNKLPQTTGRLPQTGELINYWLIFNGILLIIMMLFIFGISKQRDEEDNDIYLV